MAQEKDNKNHQFEILDDIPFYLFEKEYFCCNGDPINAIKCKMCNLYVISFITWDLFFIDNKEIYKNLNFFNLIEETCEEFIIKSILE